MSRTERTQVLLAQLDRAIKDGDKNQVNKLLGALSKKKLKRSELCGYASVLRRIGRAEQAVRLLTKIVNPGGGAKRQLPRPEEAIEYAANLNEIGAALEAITLIREQKKIKNPFAFLVLAMAHFSRWEYEEALPYLRSYLKFQRTNSYAAQVGKLNLASALVYLRKFTEADYLLKQLVRSLSLEKRSLLLGNALELAVASAYYQNMTRLSRRRAFHIGGPTS